ncbi:MAG: 50S ribosomal protein L25 [bacterium]|nr:50S ribosomal protein L25 [bacterium]
MSEVHLDAQLREVTGTGSARAFRRAGKIPAVVYSHGDKPISVIVDEKQFNRATYGHSGENFLIDLKIEKEKKKRKALIKEAQIDPISNKIIHIDFNEVYMDEKIRTHVPVSEKGEAKGVKDQGGVLEHLLREVEIECLPGEIPEKIDVDISNLELGFSIHVSDLKISKGVKILTDPGEAVFSIAMPKEIEEPAAEETAEAVAAEPEVIGKGGKEEEEPEEGNEEQEKEKE